MAIKEFDFKGLFNNRNQVRYIEDQFDYPVTVSMYFDNRTLISDLHIKFSIRGKNHHYAEDIPEHVKDTPNDFYAWIGEFIKKGSQHIIGTRLLLNDTDKSKDEKEPDV